MQKVAYAFCAELFSTNQVLKRPLLMELKKLGQKPGFPKVVYQNP